MRLRQRGVPRQLSGRKACDRFFAGEEAVDYEVTDVQVDGESAIAIADTGDVLRRLELALEDGEWKISRLKKAAEKTITGPDPAAPEATATDTAADEAAVEQTILDYHAAEGEAACQYLTEKYIDLAGGCEDKSSEVEVGRVQVDGDKAEAEVVVDGREGRNELVREGTEWKISLEQFFIG